MEIKLIPLDNMRKIFLELLSEEFKKLSPDDYPKMSQGLAIDIMTYNSYSLQYYSFRKGKIGFGFLKHEDSFLFLGPCQFTPDVTV